MSYPELILAIPTYRSSDIAQSVKNYAENFDKYGHKVPIMVFDDSKTPNHRISEGSLRILSEQFPDQEIVYVGPHEKSRFKSFLTDNLSKENGALVETLFRPSYGGNRNFIMAYTIGNYFVSVDDDMIPQAKTSYKDSTFDVVSKGKFVSQEEFANTNSDDQDIISGYLRFFGTRVGEHNDIISGFDLKDSNTDEYNNTKGPLEESVITLIEGNLNPNAKIKFIQTHLTGDADIDSSDFVNLFMETGLEDILSGKLPKKFILESFKPVISQNNMRLTGAVLGYDNTEGGVYFLPTSFRFEDYVWRINIEQDHNSACAYTENAQTHIRSLSVRNSIAKDWYNEMLALEMKKRVRDSMIRIGENKISFNPPEPISEEVAESIYTQILMKRNEASKISRSIKKNGSPYMRFAGELDSMLKDDLGNPRILSSNLTKKVEEEFDAYNKTASIWPEILSLCFENRISLPKVNIRTGKVI